MREAGVEADYAEITSDHGHDGFLAEPHLLASLIRSVLDDPNGRLDFRHQSLPTPSVQYP
jgi:hypothetical protein